MRYLGIAVLLLACGEGATDGEENALTGDCRVDGCDEGETCNDLSDRGTWVCEVLAEIGEACTASEQCESAFCVNDGSGASPYCTETCALEEDCAEGYTCDDSRGPAATFCRREG